MIKNLIALLLKKPLVSGIVIIIGIVVVASVFRNGKTKEEILVVHPGDFVQEVSVSGKVIATENLDMSFEQTGRVTGVLVKVGDKVSVGQLLASQDTAQLNAQLAEMKAGIDVQKAKLDQLLAGASMEDISVYETAVMNAERSLINAKSSLIDALKDAYTKAEDGVRNKADQALVNPRTTPQAAFTASNAQLVINIENDRLVFESTFSAWSAVLATLNTNSDLNSATVLAKKNLNQTKLYLDEVAVAINDQNSYQKLSTGTGAIPTVWKTDVSTARTNVNTALAAITTAQTSLSTAEATLNTAQNQLTLKKSPPRAADIDLAQAQIRQAEASTQNIFAQLAKKQIRAPISGVVTVVNAKVGSIVAANEVAVSLISVNALQIESFIPEKNIPLIKLGDQAAITLDAYGNDAPFMAKVISIDPAETLRDGVSTYKVKFQFIENDDRIKSGMTASIVVTTEKKTGIIAVPQGIIINKNAKKFVKVKEGEATAEREVETGSISSLGQIEITSGLKDGDTVVLEQAK